MDALWKEDDIEDFEFEMKEGILDIRLLRGCSWAQRILRSLCYYHFEQKGLHNDLQTKSWCPFFGNDNWNYFHSYRIFLVVGAARKTFHVRKIKNVVIKMYGGERQEESLFTQKILEISAWVKLWDIPTIWRIQVTAGYFIEIPRLRVCWSWDPSWTKKSVWVCRWLIAWIINFTVCPSSSLQLFVGECW